MSLFSENIKTLRKSRNLTQTGLAKDLYISHQAVSKWEKGTSVPDAEMLTAIARYFGVTVDRLLNGEIRFYPQPVYAATPVWSLDTEAPALAVPRVKTPLGVLFLIPMFILLAVVLIFPLIHILYLSMTSFNVVELPKYIGLKNYIRLFSEDKVFLIALRSAFSDELLLTSIVGTSALVFSQLMRPAHKALKYTVLLLLNLVSVSTLAGGGIAFLFSGDSYGYINSFMLKSGMIEEPIQFFASPEFIPATRLLLMCFMLFGPVLSVLSFIKSRAVSKNIFLRVLCPLEHSLHVYAAGVLPVLLTPVCWKTLSSIFGIPSADYAAHTLIDHFIDYGSIRFEVGYAEAVNVISLSLTIAFLLVFFLVSCGVMNIIALVKREIHNLSAVSAAEYKKPAAYISGGFLVICALIMLFPFFVGLANSFKGVSEIFVFPPELLPRELSLQNYIDLFVFDTQGYSFSGQLFGMLVLPLLPSVAVAAVSAVSAYGVSYFEYKARRVLYALILLSYVLLPAIFLPNLHNFTSITVISVIFSAAFFSAAPLIGFVYMKSAIENARKHIRNPIAFTFLNCIPVIFMTYVMCFINPFADFFSYIYGNLRISMYFPFGQSGMARIGADSAATVILTGITFAFLLIAAVTAIALFPRERKTLDVRGNT